MKEYRLEDVKIVSGTVYATLVTEYKFLWWSKTVKRSVLKLWNSFFRFADNGMVVPSGIVERFYSAYEAQESLTKGNK